MIYKYNTMIVFYIEEKSTSVQNDLVGVNLVKERWDVSK